MIDPSLLGSLPLFRALPAETLAQLAAHAVERRYAAGDVLFLAGSVPAGLLLVVDGTVRVLRAGGDRQHLIHEEGPGGALGEVPVFGGGGYPATAVAGTDVRCLLIPTATIHGALGQTDGLALLFLGRLAERVRGLVDRVNGLATQGVDARLARLLLERALSAAPDGGVPLGRQAEVAEDLGTVREVVVRSLRRLRDDGVIAVAGRGRYRIENHGELERRAAS